MSSTREQLIADARQYLIDEMNEAKQFSNTQDAASFASSSSLQIEINKKNQCLITIKQDVYLSEVEKLLQKLLGKQNVSKNNHIFTINDIQHLATSLHKKPHEEKVSSKQENLDPETNELLKRATNKDRCLRDLYWKIYAEGGVVLGILPNKWYERGMLGKYPIRGISEVDRLFTSSVVDYYATSHRNAAQGFFKEKLADLKKESRFANIDELRRQTKGQIEALKKSLTDIETTYSNIKSALTRAVNRHTTKEGLDKKGQVYQALLDVLLEDAVPAARNTLHHRRKH